MSEDIWGEARSVVALAQGDTVDGHQAMARMVSDLCYGGRFAKHEQRAEVVRYLQEQADRYELRWPIRIYGPGGGCRESSFFERHPSPTGGSLEAGACGLLSTALLAGTEARADHVHRAYIKGLRVENVMRDGLDIDPGDQHKAAPRSTYALPLPVFFTNPTSLDAERFIWSTVHRKMLYSLVDSYPKTHDAWRDSALDLVQEIGSFYDSYGFQEMAVPRDGNLFGAAKTWVRLSLGDKIKELEELEVNQVTVRRRFCACLRYAGTIEGVWLTVFSRIAPIHWGRSFNTGHWEKVGGEENRAAAAACDLAFTDALNALYRAGRKQGRR